MKSRNLRIDSDRLWNSLMAMAKVGPGIAGGNNRQALTDEDAAGRTLFQKWCVAEGLEVSVDKMGNMFGRRPGQQNDLPPVMVGSHLDTQPTGGKFDGPLGVIAALEIIKSLNEADIKTKHPIEVVNWTNEEGCRFAPPTMSSGVFVGAYSLEWAYARQDGSGKNFGDELVRIGWAGDKEVGERPIAAFFELHIEQGPILEDTNTDIGVVTHGQGLHWWRIELNGKDAHSGSTPMHVRQNAGLGMAKIIVLVDEIAQSYTSQAVGTVGHVEFLPNATNIIPGKALCTIDFRSQHPEVLSKMDVALKKGAENIAEEHGLKISFELVGDLEPVIFDQKCVSSVRQAADRLGYSYRDLISGACHDAFWLSQVAPSAMVMCPCVGGLSHNEAEEITSYWASASANVLFHAVLETAGISD